MGKRNSPKPDSSLQLSLSSDSSTDYWSKIQKWTNQLSKTTNHLDDLIHAMQSLNLAAKDKDALKEIISSLAKMNKAPTQKKSNATESQAKKEPSLTGDVFYDVFNSPAMRDIVQTVMKKKKRHW
ncbi:hypothetical protein [Laceyella putida]|uniref:Uncharacterized protein n=1 Tax=Laceyella putida TaxID=110101 RepID=A0ABW2RK34_9BACL